MVEPIKPSEVSAARETSIPDAVIEAFNELIVENARGRWATVMQKAVVDRIVEKTGCTRDEIFKKGWLDVEDVFRRAGWTVDYDKPGYNESYEANFRFSHGKEDR